MYINSHPFECKAYLDTTFVSFSILLGKVVWYCIYVLPAESCDIEAPVVLCYLLNKEGFCKMVCLHGCVQVGVSKLCPP